MNKSFFNRFAPIIRSLTDAELNDPAALDVRMRIARDGTIDVCYVPFEYINLQARIVIVGITPGRTQMVNALRECRRQLALGASDDAALIAAKQTGAFSGAMRPNLVNLLDYAGIHRWLGIASCDALFGEAATLVQTTSALSHAVFVDGQNYNGTPSMTRHPFLREQLHAHFGEEARALPDALYVPLGDKVAEALHHLADQGLMKRSRILDGLPHPSGANAERIAYFLGRKERADLSPKTDPVKLDRARERVLGLVQALG